MRCIDDALAMLPDKMDTPEARALLLAIGLQESRLIYRKQIGGPAKGLWQFEQGGGVAGVLGHRSTKSLAAEICQHFGVRAAAKPVYDALEFDDTLAAAFARLLLYTDPRPLPEVGDKQGAWDCYIRTWRPGRPHRHTWDGLYDKAREMAA